MRKDEQEAFYDLVYDAWRSGKNPDAVNEDRFDYFLYQGYESEEISLNMMLPQRKIHENN